MTLCENEIEAVTALLDDADVPPSAAQLIRQVQTRLDIHRKAAQRLVQELVSGQILAYHYRFGTTFIERSFNRPVQVTDHFMLHPPQWSPPQHSDIIPIAIHSGISFGSGQHPTTRLCLQAIDESLIQSSPASPALGKKSNCADIGTGSGVLAIAMCKAGIRHCDAHEIDPVSVNEAGQNIEQNGLKDRIHLKDTLFSVKTGRYQMICANLRWPTLKALASDIRDSLTEGGIAILSGAREWESRDLVQWYTDSGFSLIRQCCEKKWAGFVLHKEYAKLGE